MIGESKIEERLQEAMANADKVIERDERERRAQRGSISGKGGEAGSQGRFERLSGYRGGRGQGDSRGIPVATVALPAGGYAEVAG